MASKKATPRRKWTREETLNVLSLYCQLPFGKMHSKNHLVIELAKQIERSSNSVALKLVNLASLDPEHHKRGVKGMTNASKLDRVVWDEFYGHWDALSDHNLLFPKSIDECADDAKNTETMALSKIRRGQSFFRNSVLAAYDCKCCITGISSPQLLRASHIVPWSKSVKHRLNPSNGLLLNALHDAAFDSGLLTLDASYKVRLSRSLRDTTPMRSYHAIFEQYEGKQIKLPDRFRPSEELLATHRDTIFTK